MGSITLDSGTLTVRLTRAEKVFGLRRHDVRIRPAAVRAVAVEGDAVAAARGVRAPGLAIPGVIKVGTWRRRAGHRALIVVRRGIPAVHVHLAGEDWDEIVVSTPHAEAVAGAIRRRTGLPGPDRAVEVSIPADGARLGGTLRLPGGDGPHPAALIVPGSGPIDRDSNVRGARLGVTRDLAEALAERGIASLRYDRRGVGASDGSFLEAGFHQNAADAARALDMLLAQPEVRADACFLVGHSEGALLAMLAAAGRHDLAGVVLLAPAAKPGAQTLAWQTRRIVPGLPLPVRLLLRGLRIDVIAKQARNVERLRQTTRDVERIGGRKINARWHREFIAFDPRPVLARIEAPVLAVTGDKDIQVDPADLDVVAATVAGPVETVLVPDLTHVLRRDPGRPSLTAYRRLIRRPVDRDVLDRVAGWIAARAGGAPAG